MRHDYYTHRQSSLVKVRIVSVNIRPEKIISGGQTGVDRAALDAAMNMGIKSGGWCPSGRQAEDGRIPERYLVTELAAGQYEDRTERNVMDSDATLIFCRGELSGGTLYTKGMACKHRRPFLIVNPDESESVKRARSWLTEIKPKTLNVAGPRESKDAGIQKCANVWLTRLFTEST